MIVINKDGTIGLTKAGFIVAETITVVLFIVCCTLVYLYLPEAEKAQCLKDAKDSIPHLITAIITVAGITFCFFIFWAFEIRKDMKEGGWLYNLKNNKNVPSK